jgi:hypothetical protein
VLLLKTEIKLQSIESLSGITFHVILNVITNFFLPPSSSYTHIHSQNACSDEGIHEEILDQIWRRIEIEMLVFCEQFRIYDLTAFGGIAILLLDM